MPILKHAHAMGHFRVHLSLHFKARLIAKSLRKSVFIPIEIGTNYHNKNFVVQVAEQKIARLDG